MRNVVARKIATDAALVYSAVLHWLSPRTRRCSLNSACPQCGKLYNVTSAHIGKRVLCKQCQTILIVTVNGLSRIQPPTASPPQPPPQQPPLPPPVVGNWQHGMAPPQPVPLPTRQSAPPHVGYWMPGMAPPPQPVPPPPPPIYAFDDEDDEPIERRRGPRWLAAFGAGCGLVKWGMWVNFAGFAFMILLLEMMLIGAASKSKELAVLDKLGLFAVQYLLEIAGTIMMMLGWWRMTAAPSNSGAVGLMTGASILGALRTLSLFVGTVYLIMAVSAKGLDGLRYLVNSSTALMIAEISLLVATFSAIPGMAIVGGEIPSRALRKQAGWVTLFHQFLAIVLLTLIAFALYMLWIRDFVGDLNPAPARTEIDEERLVAPRRSGRVMPERSEPSDPTPILMCLLLVVLAVKGAYTYLHFSLYAVGDRAAARPDRS